MYILKVFLKIILWAIKTLLSMGILIFFYYQYVSIFPLNNLMVDNLNKKNILALEIGMDEEEVRKILGEPLSIKTETLKESEVLFSTEMPNKLHHFTYFIYAKSGEFSSGADISLQIEKKKLVSINIEDNEIGIYYCSKERCPKVLHQLYFDCYIPDKEGNTCSLEKKLIILKDNIIMPIH